MATLIPKEIIEVAKVSQFLVGDDIAAGSLFSPRLDPRWANMLYMERKAVEWAYFQNSATIVETANYLYSLCKFNQKALAILNSGSGGSVSPVSPEYPLPNILDFIVSDSSFIAAGESSVSIPEYIGYNLSFDRGGQPQYTTNPGDGSSYFSWNRVTGLFQCFPEAYEGEPFRLTPVG